MKILVQEPRKSTIRLWIPYCFLSGRLLSKIISKNSQDFRLSADQINLLVKGLKEAKKHFGKLTLVEVESKDQEHVKITL